MKEWGIEEKIFTLTLDNASANDTMQEILKERLNLDDNLFCGGEFFHVRCCAHILNLIVQDGLKIIGGALSKIRDSVKYIKASQSRGIAFQQCVEGDDGVVLSLDVQTRWNSTFLMLEKALRYQRAFNRFKVVDKSYKSCPSNEEWVRAKQICDILKPFYKITTLMSGTSYSTSNLYFGHVWKIERLLKDNQQNSDALIKEMADKMRVKFDKYWEQYSVILAMGAVFDPRMKFKLLKRLYDELDPSTSEAKLEYLRKKMVMLFEEYKNKFPSTMNSTSTPSSNHYSTERGGRTNFDDDLFDLDDTPDAMDEGKSLLDIYLDETKLEMKNFPEMCVLQYWKDNRHRFGALSYMACDVLSIPITTVASESSFSIGSRILNKYRSRLLPKHVQALLCTRSWLFGYVVDEKDNEAEDEINIKESDASKEDSSVI
ncbi:putative AC transposase [Cardamine amara subsp. amara]|uniref:AC transposase n=1 Tax=Cardamine amara subsp. amara TaxID=228776 RepID=A0ABD0ZWD7_CARAN